MCGYGEKLARSSGSLFRRGVLMHPPNSPYMSMTNDLTDGKCSSKEDCENRLSLHNII